MGLEAYCKVNCGGKRYAGVARLEEKELHFRDTTSAKNPFRLKIPLSDIRSAEAKRGTLRVKHAGETVEFGLGAQAEKWALKIRYPRSRMEKLGVKPGLRVAVIGVNDASFLAELRQQRAATTKEASAGLDLIFFGVDSEQPLKKLLSLRKTLQPAGAIWVVWPKGQPQIKEDHVRAAALRGGLVDVKVCAFSDTHSALKLMIPREKRP
jgi:hypothetical protein